MAGFQLGADHLFVGQLYFPVLLCPGLRGVFGTSLMESYDGPQAVEGCQDGRNTWLFVRQQIFVCAQSIPWSFELRGIHFLILLSGNTHSMIHGTFDARLVGAKITVNQPPGTWLCSGTGSWLVAIEKGPGHGWGEMGLCKHPCIGTLECNSIGR